MGQIKVRNLDDWIVGVHRDLADRIGCSLEHHLRAVLKQSALDSQRAFAQDSLEQLDKARKKYGVLPSSLDLIRDQRESL